MVSSPTIERWRQARDNALWTDDRESSFVVKSDARKITSSLSEKRKGHRGRSQLDPLQNEIEDRNDGTVLRIKEELKKDYNCFKSSIEREILLRNQIQDIRLEVADAILAFDNLVTVYEEETPTAQKKSSHMEEVLVDLSQEFTSLQMKTEDDDSHALLDTRDVETSERLKDISEEMISMETIFEDQDVKMVSFTQGLKTKLHSVQNSLISSVATGDDLQVQMDTILLDITKVKSTFNTLLAVYVEEKAGFDSESRRIRDALDGLNQKLFSLVLRQGDESSSADDTSQMTGKLKRVIGFNIWITEGNYRLTRLLFLRRFSWEILDLTPDDEVGDREIVRERKMGAERDCTDANDHNLANDRPESSRPPLQHNLFKRAVGEDEDSSFDSCAHENKNYEVNQINDLEELLLKEKNERKAEAAAFQKEKDVLQGTIVALETLCRKLGSMERNDSDTGLKIIHLEKVLSQEKQERALDAQVFCKVKGEYEQTIANLREDFARAKEEATRQHDEYITEADSLRETISMLEKKLQATEEMHTELVKKMSGDLGKLRESHDDEIERLSDEMKALEAVIEFRDEEIMSLKEAFLQEEDNMSLGKKSFEEERGTLQKTVREEMKEREEKEKDLFDGIHKMDESIIKMKESHSIEVSDHIKAKERLTLENDNLQETNDDLCRKAQKLEIAVQKKNDEIEELKSYSMDECSARASDAGASKNGEDNLKENTTEIVDGFKAEMGSLLPTIERLNDEVDEAKKFKEEECSRVGKVNSDLQDSCEEQISYHVSLKDRLESECEDLRKINNGFIRNIEALETLLREKDGEIKELRLSAVGEGSSRVSDTAASKKEKEALEENIDTLDNEMNTEKESLLSKIERLTGELDNELAEMNKCDEEECMKKKQADRDMQESYDFLVVKIETLNDELAGMNKVHEEECSRMKQVNHDLQCSYDLQILDHINTKERLESECKDLEEVNNDLSFKVDALEILVQEKNDEIERLVERCANVSSADAFKEEKNTLEKNIETLNKEFEAKKEILTLKIKRLDDEIANMKKGHREECSRMKHDLQDSYNAQISDHIKAKERLKLECVDLRKMNDDLNCEVSISKKLLKEKEDEIGRLKSYAASECSARASDAAAFKKEKENLEIYNKNVKIEKGSLLSTIERLNDEVAEMKKLKEEECSRMKEVNRDLQDSYEEQISDHVRIKDKLESECEDLRKMNNDLCRKISVSATLLEEKNNEIKQLKFFAASECTARVSDAAAFRKEKEILEENIESLNKTFSKKSESLLTEIEGLNDELAQLNERYEVECTAMMEEKISLQCKLALTKALAEKRAHEIDVLRDESAKMQFITSKMQSTHNERDALVCDECYAKDENASDQLDKMKESLIEIKFLYETEHAELETMNNALRCKSSFIATRLEKENKEINRLKELLLEGNTLIKSTVGNTQLKKKLEDLSDKIDLAKTGLSERDNSSVHGASSKDPLGATSQNEYSCPETSFSSPKAENGADKESLKLETKTKKQVAFINEVQQNGPSGTFDDELCSRTKTKEITVTEVDLFQYRNASPTDIAMNPNTKEDTDKFTQRKKGDSEFDQQSGNMYSSGDSTKLYNKIDVIESMIDMRNDEIAWMKKRLQGEEGTVNEENPDNNKRSRDLREILGTLQVSTSVKEALVMENIAELEQMLLESRNIEQSEKNVIENQIDLYKKTSIHLEEESAFLTGRFKALLASHQM